MWYLALPAEPQAFRGMFVPGVPVPPVLCRRRLRHWHRAWLRPHRTRLGFRRMPRHLAATWKNSWKTWEKPGKTMGKLMVFGRILAKIRFLWEYTGKYWKILEICVMALLLFDLGKWTKNIHLWEDVLQDWFLLTYANSILYLRDFRCYALICLDFRVVWLFQDKSNHASSMVVAW